MRIRPLCHLSGSYDQAAEYNFRTDERKPRHWLVNRAEIGHSGDEMAESEDLIRRRLQARLCSRNHRTAKRRCGSCLPCYRARSGRNFGPNVVLGMSREQTLPRPVLRHLAGSLHLSSVNLWFR